MAIGDCEARDANALSELDALCERQLFGPVDRVRLSAHVGLQGARARLAAAAGLLLSSESTPDFGTRSSDVYICDPAIGAAPGRKGQWPECSACKSAYGKNAVSCSVRLLEGTFEALDSLSVPHHITLLDRQFLVGMVRAPDKSSRVFAFNSFDGSTNL